MKKPQQSRIELLPGWEGCHLKYRENTFKFIKKQIVDVMASQRMARGLPPADSQAEAEEYQDQLDPGQRKSHDFRAR